MAGGIPLGTLSSPERAVVDGRGLVTPRPGGWSLDWWVGAEDRWHLASRSSTVRQRLVDGAPVVETALHVPGGDVVHRAYAVQAGAALAVVEVENRTPVPVALAFAIRPEGPDGPAATSRVGIDGATVTVDGRTAVVFTRPPPRMAVASLGDVDVADVVLAGQAGPSLPEGWRDPSGRASAAFVVPLPHSATARVALPLGASSGAGALDVAALATAASVARGWRAHVDRGLRLVLADERLAEAVQAARGFLLLEHLPDVGALDRFGYADEAAEALRRAASGRRAPGSAWLVALAEHWRLTRDLDLVRALLTEVVEAAESAGRARRRHRAEGQEGRALAGAAELLAAVGEHRAAATAARWIGPDEHVAPGPSGPVDDVPDPARLAAAPADLLRAVRERLVRETAEGLVLCTPFPDRWRGGGLEVHGAPTPRGRLSYAVRWHGARPALLWELEPFDDGAPVRLTASGLDPSWSSTERRGESLLAPLATAPAAAGSFT